MAEKAHAEIIKESQDYIKGYVKAPMPEKTEISYSPFGAALRGCEAPLLQLLHPLCPAL